MMTVDPLNARFSISDFKSLKGTKILSLNVRSILSKWDLIKTDLLDGSIDVVCCCETWLNLDIPDAFVSAVDYNLFRLDRKVTSKSGIVKTGGGVCTFVRKSCSVDNHIFSQYDCSSSDIEVLCLKLTNGGNRPMALLNIYRPPTGCVKKFINHLDSVLSKLMSIRRLDVICIGDYNIDLLNPSSSKSKQMLSLIKKWQLTQSVTNPTRCTAKSETLIDLVIHNIENVIYSDLIDYSISDHSPVVVCKKVPKQPKVSTSFTGRSYRNFDIDNYVQDISNSDWSDFDNATDANRAWWYMYLIFIRVTDAHCPTRNFSISRERPPYITPEIVSLSKDREFNHAKAKSSVKGSDSANSFWKKAGDLRKEVNKCIKNAKRDYILTKFEAAKNNSTKFWNTIREIVPSKKGNSKLEGVYCPTTNRFCKDAEAANVVNKFFTSIGHELNEKLPSSSRSFPLPLPSSTMPPIPSIDYVFVETQIAKTSTKVLVCH